MLKKVDVVVLSGGEGRRLRNAVSDRPKPMADINGRPFLDMIINYVSSYGTNHFILCTGYMADYINGYYRGKSKSQELVISKEDSPLGTGGAIKNAEKLIRSNPFLVMNGDSFCPVDLPEFFDFHRKKHASLSIVVVDAEDTEDYATVYLDDSQRIIQFQEKEEKRGKYINAGIYIFEKDILGMIPPRVNHSLEYELFPKLVGTDFYGYITQEKLMDIGTPERYEQAKKFLGK